MIYSSVLEEIIRRMKAHKTAGLLTGFTLFLEPKGEISAADNLPAVQLFVPDWDESGLSGNTVDASLTLKIGVSTLLSLGIVAHVKNVERVYDALEVDTNRRPWLGLPAFEKRISESFPTALAQNTTFEITCDLKPFPRGGRSD